MLSILCVYQSHVGIPKHDHADHLARSAYDRQSVDVDLKVPLALISCIKRTSCKGDLTEQTNSAQCISIILSLLVSL